MKKPRGRDPGAAANAFERAFTGALSRRPTTG